MSLTKSAIIVAATLAVVTTTQAQVTPVPPELHDRAAPVITRYCEYKMAHGGNAKCEEWHSTRAVASWYRTQMSRIYSNTKLSPEQRSAMSKELADKYLPIVKRSHEVMLEVQKEQYDEFVAYCWDHGKDPVCRSEFDRSLYEEDEEQSVQPRYTPMVFEQAELLDEIGDILINKSTSRPLKKIMRKW